MTDRYGYPDHFIHIVTAPSGRQERYEGLPSDVTAKPVEDGQLLLEVIRPDAKPEKPASTAPVDRHSPTIDGVKVMAAVAHADPSVLHHIQLFLRESLGHTAERGPGQLPVAVSTQPDQLPALVASTRPGPQSHDAIAMGPGPAAQSARTELAPTAQATHKQGPPTTEASRSQLLAWWNEITPQTRSWLRGVGGLAVAATAVVFVASQFGNPFAGSPKESAAELAQPGASAQPVSQTKASQQPQASPNAKVTKKPVPKAKAPLPAAFVWTPKTETLGTFEIKGSTFVQIHHGAAGKHQAGWYPTSASGLAEKYTATYDCKEVITANPAAAGAVTVSQNPEGVSQITLNEDKIVYTVTPAVAKGSKTAANCVTPNGLSLASLSKKQLKKHGLTVSEAKQIDRTVNKSARSGKLSESYKNKIGLLVQAAIEYNLNQQESNNIADMTKQAVERDIASMIKAQNHGVPKDRRITALFTDNRAKPPLWSSFLHGSGLHRTGPSSVLQLNRPANVRFGGQYKQATVTGVGN